MGRIRSGATWSQQAAAWPWAPRHHRAAITVTAPPRPSSGYNTMTWWTSWKLGHFRPRKQDSAWSGGSWHHSTSAAWGASGPVPQNGHFTATSKRAGTTERPFHSRLRVGLSSLRQGMLGLMFTPHRYPWVQQRAQLQNEPSWWQRKSEIPPNTPLLLFCDSQTPAVGMFFPLLWCVLKAAAVLASRACMAVIKYYIEHINKHQHRENTFFWAV